MPVLDWIGKSAVVKHHKDVPYRLLEPVPELSCPPLPLVGEGRGESVDDHGNLIVQGDNLHALKALLPRYAGQVKCIYIDPPYNTGNEGWVYNDNVNSPEIQKWLNEVVGKEGETLDRHDRWLCMMYPRLVLLKQFLRDDGVIFVSIGKDELGHLRLLLDGLFGTGCHIETFIFVTEGNTENAEAVTAIHDYVLAYSRKPGGANINTTIDSNVEEGSKLLRDFAENSVVKNGSANPASVIDLPQGFPCEMEDIDLPPFGNAEAFMAAVAENNGWIPRDYKERFNASYPIKLDQLVVRDGTLARPCRVYSGWSSANKIRRFIDEDCEPIPDNGATLRYFLDKNGVLTYRREGREAHFVSTLLRNLGSTEKDKNELERMGLKFDYPKPRKLIAYLIGLYSTSGDVVLDAFAGSGTTGHAVLSAGINNLRFVLIEMDERNATQVVAPRMRMAINGYTPMTGKNRKHVEGLGGGFQFCTLGKDLFDSRGHIDKDVRFPELANFVWFMETGMGFPPARASKHKAHSDSPLLGLHEGRAVYLLYNGILKDRSIGGGNTLTTPLLEQLPPHDGPRVVYAARCAIGGERLRKLGIRFKHLPYDLRVKP
jgi:DNA modification methylase